MNASVEIINCNNQLYTLWDDGDASIIRKIYLNSECPKISNFAIRVENNFNYFIYNESGYLSLYFYLGKRPVINLSLLPDDIYLELLIELLEE